MKNNIYHGANSPLDILNLLISSLASWVGCLSNVVRDESKVLCIKAISVSNTRRSVHCSMSNTTSTEVACVKASKYSKLQKAYSFNRDISPI